MKYLEQELATAIDNTALSTDQQKSLWALVALRWQPLFLGYLVKALGLILLVLSGYFMCQMFRLVTAPPYMPTQEQSHLAGSFGSISAKLFLLSLFLLAGASHYLNWTRQSRAVCALLMASEPPAAHP